MRDRAIGHHFFLSETLAELTPLERLFFVGLLCVADREGRLRDQPRRLRAEILPYDELEAEQTLQSLAEGGTILRYTVDGQDYIQVLRFQEHQKPHHKEAPSLLPPPPVDGSSRAVDSPSKAIVTRIKKASKAKDEPSKDQAPRRGSVPPTVEEVADYCRERGNRVDAEAFWHFYESKGWKVGSEPMKNWKSAIVTWERKRAEEGAVRQTPEVRAIIEAGASEVFIPWDVKEVREFSHTKEWAAYFSEMEQLYGLNKKWPRYTVWLKAKEGSVD